ncbi:hypothetical protein [Rhodoferax sp.]|uniref:hypothetical protein n=1 Tax=Rhodoferax sp. TaxID=50421 RepID=UPI002755F88D|nr:hypothetical protein [Rhodoferax sp.]
MMISLLMFPKWMTAEPVIASVARQSTVAFRKHGLPRCASNGDGLSCLARVSTAFKRQQRAFVIGAGVSQLAMARQAAAQRIQASAHC